MNDEDSLYLAAMVKPLVEHPDEVKVTRSIDEMGVLLVLDLNPVDMGKVIGRAGNTAKAVRALLRVYGMKKNSRINLKISEPEGSTRTSYAPVHATTIREERGEAPAMKSVDEAMADLDL